MFHMITLIEGTKLEKTKHRKAKLERNSKTETLSYKINNIEPVVS